MQGAVARLRATVPDVQISTDQADLVAHARDSWPLTAKWTAEELERHVPACVVRPQSTDAVVRIVRAVQDLDCSLVPYGAGSGVTGAAVPTNEAVVVDLKAMSKILHFDPDNGTVRVEAGVKAGDLEAWLGERGHTLGHYPQSLYLASMGGLVATRSTGTFSSKYGGIEDLLVALNVVLPTGDLVTFRPHPRTATGPKLIDLFVGAEGTLGVITTVTVKVFACPETRTLLGYSVPSLAAGLGAVRDAFKKQVVPAVLRLYDPVEAQGLYDRVNVQSALPLLIVGHEGTTVMAEAEQRVFADLVGHWGGELLGTEIGEAWEQHRFNAEWLDAGNADDNRMADAIEVAAPWTDLIPLFEGVTEAMQPLTAKVMSHFSHFYSTGGSIYFIFFIEGEDPEATRLAYSRAWDTALRETLRLNGTISHHHGVGLVRNEFIKEEMGSTFLLFNRIKEALDPMNKMNPGKLGTSKAHRRG